MLEAADTFRVGKPRGRNIVYFEFLQRLCFKRLRFSGNVLKFMECNLFTVCVKEHLNIQMY